MNNEVERMWKEAVVEGLRKAVEKPTHDSYTCTCKNSLISLIVKQEAFNAENNSAFQRVMSFLEFKRLMVCPARFVSSDKVYHSN
jgi:hypothetical protein